MERERERGMGRQRETKREKIARERLEQKGKETESGRKKQTDRKRKGLRESITAAGFILSFSPFAAGHPQCTCTRFPFSLIPCLRSILDIWRR